jgi:hypothetical protein
VDHAVAGCWRVGLERSDSTYVRWPFPVLLTTQATPRQREFIRLTAMVDSTYIDPGLPLMIYWAPLSPSVILLSIGDGLTGVRYQLEQVHPDTLRGAGRYYVDTPELVPQFARSITAVRIACEMSGDW